MSRRGGGRRGGKGGSAAPSAQPAKQQEVVVAPKLSPVATFLNHLLSQAFEDLPKAELPAANLVEKCVLDFEKKLLAELLQTPRSDTEGTHRLAVSLSLDLKMNVKLTVPAAKKVVATIFTFLVDELTNHWDEYGLTEADVHPDYKKQKQPEGEFKLPEVTQEEYQAWNNSYNFFNVQK